MRFFFLLMLLLFILPSSAFAIELSNTSPVRDGDWLTVDLNYTFESLNEVNLMGNTLHKHPDSTGMFTVKSNDFTGTLSGTRTLRVSDFADNQACRTEFFMEYKDAMGQYQKLDFVIVYNGDAECSAVGGGSSGDDGSGTTPPSDGSDPGGSDTTDPNESCLCCEELAAVLEALKQSTDNSGLELGQIKGVLDELNSAVAASNLKLDGIADALDKSNLHLAAIEKELTPTLDLTLQVPDFDDLSRSASEDIPYLPQISPVIDDKTYFSDRGDGDPVPAMPDQPDVRFPVFIGESLAAENPLVPQSPLTPQMPGQADQPKTPSPVGTVTPMQQSPLLSVTPMQRTHILSVTPMSADPLRQRTNFYERQATPGQ